MRKLKYLIAGGNSTFLVWNCPLVLQKQVVQEYLGEVEQIGFISKLNLPTLNMMGNELCVNGTLALASELGKKGTLNTSGCREPVEYVNQSRETTIILKLNFSKIKKIVLLEGIGFYCKQMKTKYSMSRIIETKNLLSRLASQYKLPAFGLLLYKENKIRPYIYVKETKSLVAETACGSGSIAMNIFAGKTKIIQPTGQVIKVTKSGDRFTVTAKVAKIK